jgi:hypothetical protein
MMTAGIVIRAGAVRVLHAQSGAPYYWVGETTGRDFLFEATRKPQQQQKRPGNEPGLSVFLAPQS